MNPALFVFPFLLTCLQVALPQEAASSITLRQGDIFHFGVVEENSHFDARFIVLDPQKTNTGEEGTFLLLESLVSDKGNPIPFRKEKDETCNSYTGSYAKAWCESFYQECFNALEKEYILPTYASEEAFSLPAAIGFGGKTPMVDFAAEEDILNGDHVFLLSAKEASSESYGLSLAENRLSSYDGLTASYWLRSPHERSSFPDDVGIVFYNGWLMDFIQDSDNVFGASPIYMRPALNISKLSSAELHALGENEYCLKKEAERFVNHSPSPSFKQRDPLPFFIVILVFTALLLIATPILIVFLIKRHKRKKAKAN